MRLVIQVLRGVVFFGLSAGWMGLRLGNAAADEPQSAALRTTGNPMTHDGTVLCVAFSPDGTTLASASRDKTIKLWDVKTAKEEATLKGHTSMVYSGAYSPDGKTLASGGWDGAVVLWEVGTGR